MSFEWLKRYMPRGIYARAFLILVLPVVTLQLVVSVVFIQRHFEGVSEQLSDAVAREIALVTRRDDPSLAAVLELDIAQVAPGAMPQANSRRWYDLTGIVVIRELMRRVPGARAVVLPDTANVTVYVDAPEGPLAVSFDRDRASASNPHQLFVNMVVFGVLMTAIAYLYLRNQLRPITRLAHAAEAFGRGRHVPYAPSGAVEVRSAGNAFIDMRARIERQIEQRTMMLSGVSHDLRTPLTRMKLALSMLEDEDREPLERDVTEMQRLIDAFLDFARGAAESGTPEMVEPGALIEAAVADAVRNGQNVAVHEVTGQGSVTLRPVAMRRALDNLIGNAVRYGTRCELSVTVTDRMVRFRVEDDGPGIAAEDREQALKPFARLDPARNQDRGSGVGLGLAIAADIARGHGGVLRLDQSERLGGLQADIVIAR
ncbi:ATP-binding protein [Litorisediminicola beolgyonensis]|uniref:histidine kinase n=1 Tax=Litorisediminicola beolgyonensis TaxID=1173614 RepID=A0ABW3ZMH0_9RHOB